MPPVRAHPEPLSMKGALRLFNRLADRRGMAFGYTKNLCYARAYLLGLNLEREGYTPSTAWAIKGRSLKRFFNFHAAGGRKISWRYHAAAALPVRRADGKTEDMVFDPGLFDGPVTLREWGRAMKAQLRHLGIVGFRQNAPGCTGNYTPGSRITPDTEEKARAGLDDVLPGKKKLRAVFASAARIEVMGADAPESSFRGKTWFTKPYKVRHPSFGE